MKYILLIIVLAFTFSRCKKGDERNRAIKFLSSQAFVLDLSRSGQCLDIVKLDSLRLVLNENGEYQFAPRYNFLKKYEGTWKLSDDREMSFYIFKPKNMKPQKNLTSSIHLKDAERDCWLHFKMLSK